LASELNSPLAVTSQSELLSSLIKALIGV